MKTKGLNEEFYAPEERNRIRLILYERRRELVAKMETAEDKDFRNYLRIGIGEIDFLLRKI